MLLQEMMDHRVMWMANNLLNKGHQVMVDIQVHVHGDGGYLILMPKAALYSDLTEVSGQLQGIEKRGQALGKLPTVVFHVTELGGEDEWHYFYEWALDYLTIKKMDGYFLLTNREVNEAD